MSGLEGLLTGRTLVKRYRIEEVIGRGGFAVVYRAMDERLGRTVAVKVITAPSPDAETRAQQQERFQREARAAASLSHPNIVTVHDFGIDPALDIDFLVMEFLHGQDLATYLAQNGRPPLDLAMRILGDAAQGLAVGHRAGLVHRDVKPGNLFLAEPHGEDPFRVCVLDFGIARPATADLTATHLTQGGVALSPAYASPEQARGERVLTQASDVFSMGVVGYQLLTGEKPFGSERRLDPAEWVPARGIREIEPSVPPAVEAVVRRAMSYAPEDRFPDAMAMARALDEAMQTRPRPAAVAVPPPAEPAVPEDATMMQPAPAAAPPPPPPGQSAPRPPPPARRSRVPAWTMLLVLLVGLGAVAVFALGGDGDGGDELSGAEVSSPVVVDEDSPTGTEVVTGPPEAGSGSYPATSGEVPGTAAPAGEGRVVTQPVPTLQTPTVPPRSGATPPSAGGELPGALQPRSTPGTAGAIPPAGEPARPRPAPTTPADSPRQPEPDSAPPRLLGVPVRPEPIPPPRDTTAAPRSDTTVADPPGGTRGSHRGA